MRPLPRTILVLVVLFVASCSSGGDDIERSEDGSTTARPQTTGADEVAEAGGPRPRPTLRLGLTGPMTLDPASISPASVSSMILVDLVHDTLTELDDAGVAGPGLATFEPNEDRTRWRFALGAEARFGDGSAITAGDVVTSIDRIRSLGGASLAAVQLEDVVAVTAVDARTVEITLVGPSAVLPEVLASPLYGIVDADVLPTAVGAPLNPSGAHDVDVVAADRLVLERRRGDGPEAIELRLFRDDAAAYEAMTAGELDWSPVPVDRLGDAGTTFGLGSLVPFHATVLLGVDTTVEPLVRVPLRQAISLAIDRTTLTEAVFGPTAQPLLGLVPTGTPGAADACAGFCGPDVAQARRLVDEAFPDGDPPAIRLLTDDSETHAAIAGVLGEQLGAIGVDLAPISLAPAAYEEGLGGGQPLFIHSTLGVGLTPATHLLAWESTSPDNLAGYAQGAVDDALRAARAEPDPVLRATRWREAESAILADVPVVPLAQLRTVAVVSERVRGLDVRADGSIDVADVELRDG